MTNHKDMYHLEERIIQVDDFMRLRKVSGLTPRPKKAVIKALPNSLHSVQVLFKGKVIGMGRIVGDGAVNFEIVDVAVDPDHQRKGVGNMIMKNIISYLKSNAFEGSYITLMADVPEFYLQFGFKPTRPRCEGMFLENINHFPPH